MKLGIYKTKEESSKARDKISKYIEEGWQYKKAESTWAGGNNYFIIEYSDTLEVVSKVYKVWSKNGWSGNDVDFIFRIPKNTRIEWIGGTTHIHKGQKKPLA